jgi:hypothetical protein
MRPSTRYLAATATAILLCLGVTLHAQLLQRHAEARRAVRARLVRELGLTDLCLFTEARYTRHPAMADLHAPFQEHPVALEHFPSGSLVTPPRPRTRSHAPVR